LVVRTHLINRSDLYQGATLVRIVHFMQGATSVSMIRQIGRKFYRLVTWEVPSDMSRTALWLLFGFMVAGFALLNDVPLKAVPTEAIGLLAAGAVVVAVRTDHLSRSEEIGWIAVAFSMFFIEMRIVTSDRAEQQAAFEAVR
jgi:hypothetical protein